MKAWIHTLTILLSLFLITACGGSGTVQSPVDDGNETTQTPTDDTASFFTIDPVADVCGRVSIYR